MHTNEFPSRRGYKRGLRPALLAGSLGLALLPMASQAQINRSRPPTPPAQSSGSGQNSDSKKNSNSGSSGSSNNSNQGSGSSGQNRNSDSGSSNSQNNRTPPQRDTSGGSGGSGNYSAPRVQNSPLTSRSSNPQNNYQFDNEVHSYTGPMSPFATYRPPNGRQGRTPGTTSVPYSGPMSPFMTYQPPKPDKSGFDRFNQTRESFQFRYRNGVFGRNNPCYYQGWGEYYFPNGTAYFPYYYPRYVQGVTTLSPYAFYIDLFPTFINTNVGYYAPPQYVYVPVPVYNNGIYSGWRRDDVDDYYLNREADRLRQEEDRLRKREQDLNDREKQIREREENANRPDRDLSIAMDNIARAWTDKDVQILAKHVRRDVRIAVYLRGKYQYSLDATDYLDMTRDALSAAKTVKFKLDKVERKEKDIFSVSGRHTYKDKEGEQRTVIVSYVLQKMDSDYIITQIGTAPEKVAE